MHLPGPGVYPPLAASDHTGRFSTDVMYPFSSQSRYRESAKIFARVTADQVFAPA